MIFKPALADAVMAGAKTVTRRAVSDNPRSPWWREACTYRVGQRFAVQPGRGKASIGHARVVDVRREPLGPFDNLDAELEARREGFTSAAEFREVFAALNGGKYDPSALVWRLELEVCP